MSKTMHGRILNVDTETRGSELDADAAAGATVLVVEDTADFDEDGGWLRIAGMVLEYTGLDDDASTVTLASGLPSAAAEGKPVEVWDDIYGEPDTVQYAEVRVDGEEDQGDSVRAVVADSVSDLPDGVRGKAAESCTLRKVSDDEWEVTAVGGRPSSTKGASAVRFATDSFTVSTAGAQAFTLSHEPAADSQHEHVRWHPAGGAGVDWNNAEWSRTGAALTIPDPGGIIEAGDKFTIKYAYRVRVTAESNIVVDWQAGGWKVLQVALSDATDRSGSGYDDSAWATGTAAFSNSMAAYPLYGWPAPSTASWALDTSIWLRRTVATVAGRNLTISTRSDNNNPAVYWNGVLMSGGATVSIPGSSVKPSNVLAIRYNDDAETNASDRTYADAQVEVG